MKKQTIYALGYFDGVHLGHQALLGACQTLARQQGCQSGAVTFLSHPQLLLQGSMPGLINTVADRKRLLHKQVEQVVLLEFDRQLLQMPWKTFLQMLVQNHGAAGFVCGSDFRFGQGGEGNARLLEAFCAEQGLAFQAVDQQYVDAIRVSSTHIRSLLEAGEIEKAHRFLGHPHVLSGTVTKGKQLGRTIGVPTANVTYPDELLKLPHGVYACRVLAQGKWYTAMTNIGTRPTVSGEGVTVESCLLPYSGNLYGQTIVVAFYGFLRPEVKFSDLSQLQQQIEKDKFLVEKFMHNYQLHP